MAKKSKISLIMLGASAFGSGYFPVASGTFATLVVGLPLALAGLAWPHTVPLLALLVTAAGVPLATAAEKRLGRKDSGIITIDEVAGYLVAMSFLPLDWLYLGLAFFLFRFFDVVKPWPISRTQKWKGGWGVMADDVLAGVFTNVLLQVLRLVVSS